MMTRDEQKARRAERKAILPGFAITDGSLLVTARTGETMLLLEGHGGAETRIYFDLETVSLDEQLTFIRGLIGIYN